MNTHALVALEEAIEPYRRAGFIITSQSEGAITLVYPRSKFNYLLFILLLLVWPLAILYLISFNNKGEKRVCVRLTSQGQIEESGYTLAVAKRDRKREQAVNSFILGILIAVMILLIFWILHMIGVL